MVRGAIQITTGVFGARHRRSIVEEPPGWTYAWEAVSCHLGVIMKLTRLNSSAGWAAHGHYGG